MTVEASSTPPPRGFGLHSKVMFITSIVLLLIFVLIGLLAVQTEINNLKDQARTRALLTVGALHSVARQAYFAMQFKELRNYLRHLDRNDPDIVEAAVYDRKNRLAFKMRPRMIHQYDSTISLERTFYVNRLKFGSVHIVYRVSSVETSVKRIARLLLKGLLASLLLVGLTVHLAVKHLISLPLGDFVETAEHITSGDLRQRIEMDGRKDEIGELSRGFNMMVGSLEASLEEIEHINVSLENIVSERTKELRQEQARTENIIESLADALITVDNSSQVTYWNHAAETMSGVKATAAEGKPIGDVLITWTRAGEDALEAMLMRTNPGRPEEAILEAKDGKQTPVVLACAPLSDPSDGEPLGAVLTIRDMTRIHELNDQIRRSDRLSSLGVLAAGVAHELNNPLGNVSTFTQLMAERAKKGKELSPDWLDKVQSEVDRASQIVTQLLEFSRREPTSFVKMDLREPIEACEGLLGSTFSKERTVLKVDMPTEPVLIIGEKSQLQQIFINLVSNAAQSMQPKGGAVEVVLKSSLERPNFWEVTVSDEGCGIADEHADKVFNPFFTTKDVGKGTGLGLSVTYGIIQDHGGEIAFQNRPGGGTTFTVLLPAAPVEATDETEEDE